MVLKINGFDMPYHKKVSFTEEIVYSNNHMEMASGKIVGDIKGYRDVLTVEWDSLSASELNTILTQIKITQYPTVTWYVPGKTATVTSAYEVGVTSSSWRNSCTNKFDGLSLTFTEQSLHQNSRRG